MNPILEISGVSFRYLGKNNALRDITFPIESKAKIALVGANGAGKSTLLLMLNGMLRPDAGEIRFHGELLKYSRTSLRNLRQKIGFVFQDADRQIIAPTVWQDVAFGPANLEYSREKIESVVLTALHQVGLEGFERRPPHQLSGGEKKRVAIAGILAMDPEVLILDEPTSMLDPAGSEDIMDLLEELHHQGKTIIISTHDVELAYSWADTIILMEKGEIIARGTPEQAFADKELVRRARLKMPVIVELYTELIRRGVRNDSQMPRSILDMIRIIECDRHGGMQLHSHGCGVITVVDVALADQEMIKRIVEDKEIRTIGAMGSRAKICARQWGVIPDYTYAVIDKCILHAMNGRRSLILTSGGMVPRVVERVQEFNSENKRTIQVITGLNNNLSEVLDNLVSTTFEQTH
ncbi:ATP-binding cassette domain-containing protein [uncultured Methanospirillum sp.]|uniref:energy-coupling factor ABC transporter ATP-binding protein n=1 Tax=uncultured Methanospirillum sp. TaxID=262503 RepID=UPI0029C61042|nr:ATP-binding cassette domain-containing protein [uncultured Methanospirillum sp.]